MNSVGGKITGYSYSESMFDGAKVGYFPLAFEFFSESVCLVNRRGGGDYVIDMENENGGTSRRLAVVHTPLTGQVDEVPIFHSLVESLIPHAASLFHPVDTLEQLHNPVFFILSFEARRLFKKHSFIVRENTV